MLTSLLHSLEVINGYTQNHGGDWSVSTDSQSDELYTHVWVSGMGKLDTGNSSGQGQAETLN